MRAKRDRWSFIGLRAMSAIAACSWMVACSGTDAAPTIVTGEVVEHDLVTAGRTVRVEARVDGDVAAAGGEVTFSAPVAGYIMGAGRRVSVDAPVENDVWAAGEQVTVGGRVGDNAMLAGQTVRLAPGATIGRNARIAGAEVTSEGRIVNDLVIGADRAVIGGEVGGEVRANAGRVTVMPGTIVRGDLIVRSPQPPEIPPDAQVLGTVDYQPTERESGWLTWPAVWAGLFLSLLVLGLAALALAPAWSERVVGTLRMRTLASVLAGAIVLICVPFVIVVLLITMIGIPLAIVLTAVYVSAVVLSGAFVSYQLGRWLFERAHRPGASRWAAIAVGALVVSLGVSLPIVGWLVALAVVLTGAGALAMAVARPTAPPAGVTGGL